MNNGVVVNVKGLKKYYGKVKAVDGVDFVIHRGEVFSLLGPNGAGKTTTMEILEGIRDKDTGEVEILEMNIENNSRKIKEKIGVLLQDTNFINNVKVVEIIDLFRSFFKNSLSTEEILDIISLKEKRNTYVNKLSGGQKQRLAVGLALVNDPEIVFLDEPTTGLDPQARRNLWDTIKNLKESRKTIFLTTHYMEEAERLADRIAIMDHGKIIAKGTALELIKSIGREEVIEFSREGLSTDFLEMLKQKGECVMKDTVVRVYTKNIVDKMRWILDVAKKYDTNLRDLRIRQTNLEDVFLELTGRELRD